jgi:hypothetical protein
VFPRYQSGGRKQCRKNPEEPIVTKLESNPLFSKDLEDEFIEIMNTKEVKYLASKGRMS